MIILFINFLLLFISQATSFNISHFIFPKISDEFRPQPSLFLTDVVRAISDSEKWENDEVRVSKVELEKVKFGNMNRYEVEFMFGNRKDYLFSLFDKVLLWKRFGGTGSDFEVLANDVSERGVLGVVRVDGPVELVVSGEDAMSLVMPWNVSYDGLKRIVVGEDVTIEVKNAREVSVFQAGRNVVGHRGQCNLWFLPCLICMPLLPVRVSGSASVSVFRARNRGEYVRSNILSKDVVELLSGKCYSGDANEKQQCPIVSLRSRIRLLEKVLKGFLGDRINRNGYGAKLKAKVEASTAFRFQLELERNIRKNDTRWSTVAEWRTRPTVEHVWYEVLARIERKGLKPLAVKKIKPFVGVDSSAWSNLMANMSFTKLASVLVAPEALTLDVNW